MWEENLKRFKGNWDGIVSSVPLFACPSNREIL